MGVQQIKNDAASTASLGTDRDSFANEVSHFFDLDVRAQEQPKWFQIKGTDRHYVFGGSNISKAALDKPEINSFVTIEQRQVVDRSGSCA